MSDNLEPYTGTTEGQLYGVTADNRPRTIGEKLSDLFTPSDFVRVINIDNQDFMWQSLNPKDETYFMEPGPQKTTVRGKPRLYTVKAAQSVVLEGWNAYIMIEQLYKKVSARAILEHRKASQDGKPTDTPLQWGDSEKQDYYIKKIFLGIETPSFGQYSRVVPQGSKEYESANPVDAATLNTVDDIAKELGLDEPKA
jgi:hypothetical protein